MDEAGVDYAVLSLTSPGAEQFEVEVGKRVAEDANNVIGRSHQRSTRIASVGSRLRPPKTSRGRSRNWSVASRNWASRLGDPLQLR